jgi:N6-adenosine-specific RNA methylase IME4
MTGPAVPLDLGRVTVRPRLRLVGLHDSGPAPGQAHGIGDGQRAAGQQGERGQGDKGTHGHGRTIPLPCAVENLVENAGKTGWPFEPLPAGQAGAILCDPPWRFKTFSAKGEGKSPQAHYPCMVDADLAQLPVADLAAPSCALFMWATAPMLPHAMATLDAWGFRFKTAAAWAKQSSTGRHWAFGTGFIFRSAAEFLLVGTRGKPAVRSRAQRNLLVAPVREHSRKPDSVYAMVESLFAGP